MTKGRLFAVAVAACLAGSAVSWAQTLGQTPEEQVQRRQHHMDTLGDNVRVITRYLRSNDASIEDVRTAARAMAEAGHDIAGLFPPGTAVGVGRSKAQPNIWENWDSFTQAAHTAETGIAALVAAADSGDRDAVRVQFAQVGQACSACHRTYRAD